jgi:HEPN domain-containing protein
MPRLIECGKKTTPPLNAGDKLKHVNQGGNEPEITFVNRDEGLAGIYTGGIGYCTAVTLVARDKEGQIQSLAMAHLSGGANAHSLDSMLDQAKKEGFKISDIVVQFGENEDESHKQIVEQWLSANKEKYNTYTRKDQSSCVTFSGFVGNCAYDDGSSSKPEEFNRKSGRMEKTPLVIGKPQTDWKVLAQKIVVNNPEDKGLKELINEIEKEPKQSDKNKLYERRIPLYQEPKKLEDELAAHLTTFAKKTDDKSNDKREVLQAAINYLQDPSPENLRSLETMQETKKGYDKALLGNSKTKSLVHDAKEIGKALQEQRKVVQEQKEEKSKAASSGMREAIKNEKLSSNVGLAEESDEEKEEDEDDDTPVFESF